MNENSKKGLYLYFNLSLMRGEGNDPWPTLQSNEPRVPLGFGGPPCDHSSGTINPPENRDARCDLWLIGQSAKAPRHLCFHVLYRSVYYLLWQHGNNGKLHKKRRITWPLPAGRSAIYEHMAHETNGALLDKNEQLPPILLADHPNAYIGLALRRTTKDGVFWLLGTQVLTHTQNIVRPDPRNADKYHYQYVPSFIWSDCVVVRQGHLPLRVVSTPPVMKQAVAWYHEAFLGRPARGRPRGTGQFPSREDFLHQIRNEVSRIRKEGRGAMTLLPTLKEVAASLGVTSRTVNLYLAKYELGPWQEVIKPMWDDTV